jgi:hypothetical protein
MRRGKTNFAQMAVAVAIASAVGIAGGLLINWFPEAASTQSGPIDTLWDVLLIVSIPIIGAIETGPRSATRSSSDSGRTVSCVSSDPIGAGSYVTDATEGTAAGRARTMEVVRRRAGRVRPATAAGAATAARRDGSSG